MDVPQHDAIDFLNWAARQKKFLAVRDRLRAIILARQGQSISQISVKLDYTGRWVQKWVSRYRKLGFDGLWDKPRSGRSRNLPAEQEETFIQRIFLGPTDDDSVSIFHARDIQKILAEEFHATYSESGVYALLARLKLAWITTRPRHEHNDPEKMKAWKEAFKANFLELKKTSRKASGGLVPR